MTDTIIKLRILWDFLASAFEGWRSEVWDRDLDERYCCDGRECGCQGISVREMMTHSAGKGEV